MFDEVDRTGTLIIRTLRAATWQGHYLPKRDYMGLTHALLAGGEVANLNRTRGGTAGSTFVKNFGAGATMS